MLAVLWIFRSTMMRTWQTLSNSDTVLQRTPISDPKVDCTDRGPRMSLTWTDMVGGANDPEMCPDE
uniref:Uncharacterized protein n=1 Tax=Anguilla anguilla TaxID=7936 RepID=A0A0E9XPR4_ANGAN